MTDWLQKLHDQGWVIKVVNAPTPQNQPPFWRVEAVPPMALWDDVDDFYVTGPSLDPVLESLRSQVENVLAP